MAKKSKSTTLRTGRKAKSGAEEPRGPANGVIGKTPEGFAVYAPHIKPTLAKPREIRRWVDLWVQESGKPAKAQ